MTIMKIAVILVLLFSSVCYTSQELDSQCLSSTPGEIAFSVISKKNKTGQWNAEVFLKQINGSESDDKEGSGSVAIDVRQNSEKCGRLDIVKTTVTLSAPAPTTIHGYELVPELGYYKFHTTPKNWPEARQVCRDEGAHLAIINSEKELRALQGIFSLHPDIQDGWQNNNAHVGFHDLYSEGQYLTIFGANLNSTGYTKFAEGEPNGECCNCGCIHRNMIGLRDVGCDNILPFFCEQELK